MVERHLTRYRCHKEVMAAKIVAIKYLTNGVDGALIITDEDGANPIKVGSMYLVKHNPSPGGYFVVYEDGYESFSPAAAFEKGYTRI